MSRRDVIILKKVIAEIDIRSHFKGEYIEVIFSKAHNDVSIRYADGCTLLMCINKDGKYQMIHSTGEHEHGLDQRILKELNK